MYEVTLTYKDGSPSVTFRVHATNAIEACQLFQYGGQPYIAVARPCLDATSTAHVDRGDGACLDALSDLNERDQLLWRSMEALHQLIRHIERLVPANTEGPNIGDPAYLAVELESYFGVGGKQANAVRDPDSYRRGVPIVIDHLAEFEAWYLSEMHAAGWTGLDANYMLSMRDGDTYGAGSISLNGKWRAWQAARGLQ